MAILYRSRCEGSLRMQQMRRIERRDRTNAASTYSNHHKDPLFYFPPQRERFAAGEIVPSNCKQRKYFRTGETTAPARGGTSLCSVRRFSTAAYYHRIIAWYGRYPPCSYRTDISRIQYHKFTSPRPSETITSDSNTSTGPCECLFKFPHSVALRLRFP